MPIPRKILLFLPSIFIVASLFAQTGYEIKVTLKPFKNEYIFLGYYSGKQYPVVDSVKVNDKSEGVFKGKEPLGGGIYLIVFPSRNKFFEILVDKQQHFSVIADTANLATGKKFINSPDNQLFDAYQRYMNTKGQSIDSAHKGLQAAGNSKDSAFWTQRLQQLNNEVGVHRREIISKNPDNILSVLLHLMEEPQIPSAEKHPNGKYDSTYAYRFFKDHYWDGINFWDDRISRTPASLFEERLDKYFNTLVYPGADSVNREIDWMLGYASGSKELFRFLLVKFVTRYLNMKYMWEDKVFVHLYEKYFSQKDYDWLTPGGKKLITDRAYSLMANIMGNPAENITLPDTAGLSKSLYGESAPFSIVVFWDPTCGHCKETLPKIDSIYRAKWKANGVKIYAVAKETEGNKQDWLDFIRTKHLEDWTNVYYSKAEEKTRIDANIPGYSQLYDVQTFPTVYLLDKDKRIVAKKLSWEQTDEIMEIKRKGGSIN
jgi:thiol-disulfide isomerase/thioredoxin